MGFRVLAGALLSALLWINDASAQDYGAAVYNAVQAAADQECLAGKLGAADFTAGDAGTPAKTAVIKYWSAARSADNVRIADLFQSNGKAVWIGNGVAVLARSGTVTDPFARAAGAALVEDPVALIHAKRGQTARGLWQVRDQSGASIGHYLVDFRRGSDWRPQRMELLPPGAPVPDVKPYCYMPGDIEASKDFITDAEISKMKKRATLVATCMSGSDCGRKWARAQAWVTENSFYPLVRTTDDVLLTTSPGDGSLWVAYVVALDPPATDGRQNIRLRAWCRNFLCVPSIGTVRRNFASALEGAEEPQTENRP